MHRASNAIGGQKDDGGVAFPSEVGNGLSTRDYFAARAPMPEASYVCEAMGWDRDLRIGDEDEIGQEQWQDSMLARWHELPFRTRVAVICRHAYEWADAMIEARKS